MREPLAKTKVVVRKLPPHLKEEVLKETIDSVFSGLYDWFTYYPGKTRCDFLHLRNDHLPCTWFFKVESDYR